MSSELDVGTVDVDDSVAFTTTHVTAGTLPVDGVIVDPSAAIKLDGGLTVKGLRFTGRSPRESEMVEIYCVGPLTSTLKVNDAPNGEKFVDLTGPDLDVTLDPYRRRIQLHYEPDLNGWLPPNWSV